MRAIAVFVVTAVLTAAAGASMCDAIARDISNCAFPDCSNPDDCTAEMQDLLSNTSVPMVCIGDGTVITNPLSLVRSNVVLWLQYPSSVLLAKRWSFNGTGDTLLTVSGAVNVSICGNGGAFRMWKDDYANPKWYTPGQWRMALSLLQTTSVLVSNLTLQMSGGDGVYVGGLFNVNTTLEHLNSRRNYRQGISVITAHGLVVRDSVFQDSHGTAPQSGVDFEPDYASQPLVDILFDRCVFRNNSGWQVQLAVYAFDANTPPLSLTMRDCVIVGGDSAFGGVLIEVSENVTQVPGARNAVVLDHITVLDVAGPALWGIYKAPYPSLSLSHWTVRNATYSSPAPYLSLSSTFAGVTMRNSVLMLTHPNASAWVPTAVSASFVVEPSVLVLSSDVGNCSSLLALQRIPSCLSF